MEQIYLYITSLALFTLLQTSSAILVFAYNLKRKNKFKLRLTITILCHLLFSVLLNYINFLIIQHFEYSIETIEHVTLVSNLISNFIILLIYFFLFNENKTVLLLYSVASQMTCLIFETLYNIGTLIIGVPEIKAFALDGFYLSSLISYILIFALVFLSAFFLNKYKISKYTKDAFLTIKNYILVFFIFVEIAVIFIGSAMRIRGLNDDTLLMWLDIFQLLLCSIILLVMFFLLKWSNDIKEKAMIDKQYSLYKNQHEMMKESIEMINIKCHDLKKIIAQKLEIKDIDDEFIEDVKNSINIYDANINVNNDTLNILFSQKSLECTKKHIDLSIILDATKLIFLSPSDLFSLFGNAIDNAIEREEKEKEEDRFIKVKSVNKDNFIVIKIENYCSSEVKIDDKSIKTTKNDTFNHGFGIKSMKNIVSKYHGQLNFLYKDNVFELTIFFNLKNTK